MAYGATNSEDEEDFKSRYGSGMPPALAAAAAKNLAAEDLSIAKVNAAGRLTALPAVGSTYSTPQTDQTNLNVADAMERSDLGHRFGFGSPQYQQGTDAPTLTDTHIDDIMERRSQIDEQRKEIQAKLGIIQPSQAGFSAVVLANPVERKRLLQDLNVLDEQSNQLLTEHHYASIGAAKQAHENLARQTQIQAADGKAKILNGIANINEQFPKDSKEHRLATLKLFGSDDPDIAAARGTSGFESLVKPYIDQHDRSVATSAAIKQAIDNYESATGLKAGSVETTATGGINIRGKSAGEDTIPSTVQARYSKLLADVQQHEEESKSEESGNIKANLPDTPYSKATEYHAARTQMQELEKRFPGLKLDETAPSQFDDEESARKLGHKTGDVVMLLNPKTKKYQRARLD